MRIAVLSDTHASRLEDLPSRLLDALAGADMVLHLGDYTGMDVVDGLRQLYRCEGVHGNMDSADVKLALPEQRVIVVEGKRIGMVHGWGAPLGLEAKVRARFSDVDVVLYGHTHRPSNRTVGDVLVFNPGSAAGRFPALYASYGILTVDETVRGEIVRM